MSLSKWIIISCVRWRLSHTFAHALTESSTGSAQHLSRHMPCVCSALHTPATNHNTSQICIACMFLTCLLAEILDVGAQHLSCQMSMSVEQHQLHIYVIALKASARNLGLATCHITRQCHLKRSCNRCDLLSEQQVLQALVPRTCHVTQRSCNPKKVLHKGSLA